MVGKEGAVEVGTHCKQRKENKTNSIGLRHATDAPRPAIRWRSTGRCRFLPASPFTQRSGIVAGHLPRRIALLAACRGRSTHRQAVPGNLPGKQIISGNTRRARLTEILAKTVTSPRSSPARVTHTLLRMAVGLQDCHYIKPGADDYDHCTLARGLSRLHVRASSHQTTAGI